jgi:hypothetical protein
MIYAHYNGYNSGYNNNNNNNNSGFLCGYMMGYMNNTGWWFQPTPLKNDGVRQLG